MSLTVGSLFSGIGGLELGLERAGMKTLWQVEKDAYAQRVLKKHWPDAQRFDDVCAVGAHNLPAVDLICGGFPCQDISLAGKGAGLKEGTRSGLWFEYARIVRELRPRFVLVENVPALRSRGLDRVLGDLAACGYDCEWDGIPARAVGALHQRDRIFVVAYAKREFVREQPGRGRGEDGAGASLAAEHGAARSLADADGLRCDGQPHASGGDDAHGSHPRGDEAPGGVARICASGGAASLAYSNGLHGGTGRPRGPDSGGKRKHVSDRQMAHSNGAGLEEWKGVFSHAREELAAFERGCSTGAGVWSVEPDVGRVADGVPKRVDRLRCLGNAVVPQVAEFVGRRILHNLLSL